MRRLLIILISFAILSQSLNSAFIFVSYSLNKNYITKTYCINKDKPKMHCNGKCHLMKELKDQEQKDSAPVNSLKEKSETIVYLSIKNNLPFSEIKILREIFTPYYERTFPNFYDQPFQPPQV